MSKGLDFIQLHQYNQINQLDQYIGKLFRGTR